MDRKHKVAVMPPCARVPTASAAVALAVATILASSDEDGQMQGAAVLHDTIGHAPWLRRPPASRSRAGASLARGR
jgi:hypothetical protein